MPLNKAQTAVAKSEARFRVFVAGRRTGKTFLSVRELARFGRNPDQKILYLCPTYQMARDIIWKDLKEKLGMLRWIQSTNESRLEIILINGSKISLRSADNPDSLRGGGYDFVVFDECQDIKALTWYEVIRPALSAQKPPGSAMFVGTPKGFNWFKDLYDLGKTDDPDWASFQFTTLDGGNVPESEIEAARRDLDERTFRAEYLASFETYSGVIAYNFKEANIKKFENEIPKTLYIGTDFNVNPMSAVVFAQTTTGLHAIDEIVMYSSNTDELVEEVKNRYPTQKIFCFPDPAGVQRKTSANGRTDVTILQNAGFVVKYRNKHPAVRDRINAANALLLNSNSEIRLHVDPKCRQFIKSLQRHVYKEGTQIPDKSSGFDHLFDAATYLIEYLFPVTKEIERKPSTWGAF